MSQVTKVLLIKNAKYLESYFKDITSSNRKTQFQIVNYFNTFFAMLSFANFQCDKGLNMFFLIPFNWSKPQTCNRSRQGLSTFDPLFNEVTDEMYQRLTKKFDLMTSLDDALDFYHNQTDKVEKGFLDLFLVVGKNNVSEVIFWQNKCYIWNFSIANW